MSEKDFNHYTIKFLYWAVILMVIGLILAKAGII